MKLPHRVAHVLASAADGFGDFSILLARIRRGQLLMHVHPGEAIYIAGGAGRFWLEGIPYVLEEGVAGFTPPSLWHSFESTTDDELVILGVVCPGVIVGRYEELPPIFEPSGRIASVDHLHHRVDAGGSLSTPLVLPLVDDAALAPLVTTRLLRLPDGSSLRRPARTGVRAWVVVSGAGRLEASESVAGPLRQWDTIVVRAGGAAHISGDAGLAVVEIELRVEGS